METFALGVAINLVSTLLVSGAGRLREEALGDDQERALKEVFRNATSAMLVEIARHARDDRVMLEHLEERFGEFFGDVWVAEKLVGIALGSDAPPVAELRRRYEELGFDADTLPVDFERAMRLFVFELAGRLSEEASRDGSPLNKLVEISHLEAIRGMVGDLVRARGAPGPDVDELERESLARCAER